MKSRHQKVGHTPTRAGAWKASHRRRTARGSPWRAVFRRGFLRCVDWPHASRNLRFPTGEEPVGKVNGGKEIRRRRVPGGE